MSSTVLLSVSDFGTKVQYHSKRKELVSQGYTVVSSTKGTATLVKQNPAPAPAPAPSKRSSTPTRRRGPAPAPAAPAPAPAPAPAVPAAPAASAPVSATPAAPTASSAPVRSRGRGGRR